MVGNSYLEHISKTLNSVAIIAWTSLCIIALIVLGAKVFAWGNRSKLSISIRNKCEGIILGKLPFINLKVFSPVNAEQHVAVFGGTGLGKTSSILIPTLNAWKGSSFVIDISGDISSEVNNNYPRIIFAPESLDCIPYDVFYQVKEKNAYRDIIESLEQLAYLIMPEVIEGTDAAKFFNDGGRNFLIASLIAFYPEYSFVDICKIIVESDWKTLCQRIDSTGRHVAMNYISSFFGASEQNNAGCKGTCDDAVKLFATNEYVINALTVSDSSSFSPKNMEDCNVFIKISDSKLNVYSPLLHIITAQCLDYFSSRANKKGNHILLALDEFVSLGKLEILPALRKYRKKRVRIMILTQSLSDLRLLYGQHETEAMLENFAFKVVLGATSYSSQEYFSKLCGNKKKTRGDTKQADYSIPAIEPSKFANLGDSLILLNPAGYIKLKKNYYYK